MDATHTVCDPTAANPSLIPLGLKMTRNIHPHQNVKP